MRESDTEIIERHPLLNAVLCFVLKRLENMIALAVTAACVAMFDHHQNHKQIWNEAGPKMSDQHQEIYKNVDAIAALSNRVNQLEHK